MVEIKDFAFSPAAITVKKGTKVTWTNKDSTQHNISPDTETADFKASELLAQGESYSVTFNTVGTFSYHCTPHPYMKASVIVTE
jgi:amicyanin